MGLLFTPARNKYIVMGEKRGYARAAARFADWFARKEQAEKEGKDFTDPPPFLNGNGADDARNSQR